MSSNTNEPNKAVKFFIVSGKRLLDDPVKFAYQDDKFPALHPDALAEFENAWSTFS